MTLTSHKIIKWSTISIMVLIVLFFVLDLIFPLNANVEFAPVVYDRNGAVIHTYITKDEQWRMKARLEEITPQLRETILFKEDKHFYHHYGINPLAIMRALVNNVFHHRRTSGASTITMQVARMLDRKPRNYWNKIVEMFRALQLETSFSKDEILQLYLNLVPYGSNIQGVKAASILYFNKSPDQLSLAELTALSVIPNRPNSLVMGKDNAAIMLERNKWLKKFAIAKLFPSSVINDALEEPLTAYRHQAPGAAPQFCWRMRFAYPQLNEIHTTLDADLQQKAEDMATNYANGLRLQQIYNAAVIVVDNHSHEVLAYIGSPNFNDKEHHGEVDGVQGARSPGSALKPLLYGLAFDYGLLTPKTVIADVPINIAGYSPENYDLNFRGNVTIEDALRWSLNIPAVKTLEKLGVKTFSERMAQFGFKDISKEKKNLGLSMILGGCEVRLDGMAALYSAFANEGNYHGLRFVIPDSVWKWKKKFVDQEKPRQVISPAANYMIAQIMLELHRPDLPNLYDHAKNIPRVAWKTGTSYGRKDGWSIGFNQQYTIGVWVGNFNGDGAPSLSGAGTATPLLFQLFTAIDPHAANEWQPAPHGISYRMVCSKTGKLPNDYCEELVSDAYIPGISSNEVCDHIREVWVTADESFSYCTSCLPANGYKTVKYPNIDADLANWFDATHFSYQKIPQHNPACNRIFDGHAPVITSLQNGLTYLIADKEKQALQLECNTANDVHKVYWYVNDKFLGSTESNKKISFFPSANDLKISCTDDKGRTANISIKVKFI